MAIFNRKNRALSRVLRNILRVETASAVNIPAASVPASKAISPAPAATSAPAYSLPTDIPKNYRDTYVRAIPKDPQSAFVYWERPREETRACVFPDMGTAHVGNDEVTRVQQQLGHGNNPPNDNNSHRRGNGHHRQDNNRRWLDENSRWLNNTTPWDGGSNQRHDNDNHLHHRHDYNNDHRHDDNNRHSVNPNAPVSTISTVIGSLISQCRRHIEGGKHHQYVPSPSSAEIYKVNTEKQQR
jgi:hypothetical protein